MSRAAYEHPWIPDKEFLLARKNRGPGSLPVHLAARDQHCSRATTSQSRKKVTSLINSARSVR